jgi:Domain of unknown function (DUF4402)
LEQKAMKTALKIAAGLGAISALSGLASTAYAQAPNNATATASGSATIIQSISITKTTDLGFGTIVKPTTTTTTVTVDTLGVRGFSGGNATGANAGGVSKASFTIQGEGNSAISVTVPTSFSMTAGTNTLIVTTAATPVTGNLSGSIGTQGSFIVGVGGSFPLATNTPSGAYSGSLVVSVAYN